MGALACKRATLDGGFPHTWKPASGSTTLTIIILWFLLKRLSKSQSPFTINGWLFACQKEIKVKMAPADEDMLFLSDSFRLTILKHLTLT